MNDRELRQLKSDLQSHIDAAARLEGKEAALLERLKKEFDVDSLEDAQKLLDDMSVELDTSEGKLQEALDKLEKREESDE